MHFDQRFENSEKNRYYRMIISKDLFGDWVVTRVWGGIGKPSGRVLHIACKTYEDAVNLATHLAKIKKRRGYKVCTEQNSHNKKPVRI